MALIITADHRYTPTGVGTDKGAHYHREVNMFGPNTLASMELATSHGITPDRCDRCGSDTGNWRGPLVDGVTEENDDGALLWECRDCGNMTSRTADQVRALAMPQPAQPNLCDERAGLRVVSALVYIADRHKGQHLDDLDPNVRGELVGLAAALAAIYENSWGGAGELYGGPAAWLADAITWARQAENDQAAWAHMRAGLTPQ